MTTSPLEPAPAAPAPVAPTAAPVTAAPTITGPALSPTDAAGHAPPPAAEPASTAYPEDDKLGPVPGGPPPVIAGLEVRARVLAEIKDAVAAARAAANKAAADPATAVHEVRKALRRMRAVVDAVAPALTRDAHRDLRRALIEARRTLGPSRDHTVAQIALTELPPEHAEHARTLIASAAEQAPAPAAEQDAIAAAVAEADAQAVALAAALPDGLRPGLVARGLASTYAKARRARRRARRSEPAIHRWRRRSKELVYQLALVADDERGSELKRALVEADAELGHVVDRILLKDFVGLHGGALDGEAVGALLAHVHDQLLDGRDKARASSKALFATRPRKLRKQLRRALRDAVPTPPADAGD